MMACKIYFLIKSKKALVLYVRCITLFLIYESYISLILDLFGRSRLNPVENMFLLFVRVILTIIGRIFFYRFVLLEIFWLSDEKLIILGRCFFFANPKKVIDSKHLALHTHTHKRSNPYIMLKLCVQFFILHLIHLQIASASSSVSILRRGRLNSYSAPPHLADSSSPSSLSSPESSVSLSSTTITVTPSASQTAHSSEHSASISAKVSTSIRDDLESSILPKLGSNLEALISNWDSIEASTLASEKIVASIKSSKWELEKRANESVSAAYARAHDIAQKQVSNLRTKANAEYDRLINEHLSPPTPDPKAMEAAAAAEPYWEAERTTWNIVSNYAGKAVTFANDASSLFAKATSLAKQAQASQAAGDVIMAARLMMQAHDVLYAATEREAYAKKVHDVAEEVNEQIPVYQVAVKQAIDNVMG